MCVNPFFIHKQLARTNLHEVTLPKFHSVFSTYLGVCMKCFKRSKNNVAASTVTTENEVKIDEKEGKDKISVKTAQDLVSIFLKLFDYPPPKEVKPDRTH